MRGLILACFAQLNSAVTKSYLQVHAGCARSYVLWVQKHTRIGHNWSRIQCGITALRSTFGERSSTSGRQIA